VTQAAQDKQLVKKMLAGDERSFDEFFARHFPGLYRFAFLRLGHDADMADEIVQETLCRAIRKLHTYRGEAMLFSWLCTFCRHEISAALKRKGRIAQVDLAEEAAEVRAALESLGSLDADPEASLRRRELGRLVQVVLDHLPPRYGSALEWKYLQDLSVKEIAERLHLSPKAAESLLTRARWAFRDGFTSLTAGAADSAAMGWPPS
jgi:RNA polymerase sigma-70 factor, ECF subfamily